MGTHFGIDLPTIVGRVRSGPIEYRLERRGSPVVVAFHGGHCRAGIAVGEEVFAAAGCTVLAPSRPGYGRTPLSTGPTPAAFADAVRELCDDLGLTGVTSAGTSAGGPTAVHLAARHPDLVERLVLQSAVGWLRWPDRRTRIGAAIGLRPHTEAFTWAVMRAALRLWPDGALRVVLRDLTRRPSAEVLAALSPAERVGLVALFTAMRSGSGFHNDLRSVVDPCEDVAVPTLVIASPHDGGVPFEHARSLAAAIAGARLVESRADTHLIWLGPDWPEIARAVTEFLRTG